MSYTNYINTKTTTLRKNRKCFCCGETLKKGEKITHYSFAYINNKKRTAINKYLCETCNCIHSMNMILEKNKKIDISKKKTMKENPAFYIKEFKGFNPFLLVITFVICSRYLGIMGKIRYFMDDHNPKIKNIPKMKYIKLYEKNQCKIIKKINKINSKIKIEYGKNM